MSTQECSIINIDLSNDCSKFYLMFAYDCLIFCRASKKAARKYQVYIGSLFRVSGQLVNYNKSKVQFFEGFKKKKNQTGNIRYSSNNSY